MGVSILMCMKDDLRLNLVLNMHSSLYMDSPNTGYPLKFDFQIPCVFPVFSLIDVIYYYYIHKTDMADLSSVNKNLEIFSGKYQNIVYL